MKVHQKLLEMRQRDNDIRDNLRELRGDKYTEAVSAFANLLSAVELTAEVVPTLRDSLRLVAVDVHQTMAMVLDVDFETFMTDVVMVAKSRLVDLTGVQGGNRG